MGAGEESYRLYHCGRCAQQVQICRYCDRGNQYCAGECARIRRRESVSRAGRRYQGNYRGACRHAARQRVWRERHAKVTHQGSLATAGAVIVVSTTTTTTQESYVDITSVAVPRGLRRWPVQCRAVARARCSFCGRELSPFARLGPLRGGP